NKTTTYVYDDQGDVCTPFTCYSDGQGHNQGNLCQIIDAANHITCFQYEPPTGPNQHGRRLKMQQRVTDSDGVVKQVLTQYTYYPDNNQKGNLKEISVYWAPCQPVPWDHPCNPRPPIANTIYTYDNAGNVQTLTDPEGKTTQFVRDALNRVTAIC